VSFFQFSNSFYFNFTKMNSTTTTTTSTQISTTENSESARSLRTLHVVDIINFFLMLLGIITNSLCICIFTQKSSIKTKFNWYLLTLSISELLFCLIIFSDNFSLIISKIFLHELNIYSKIILDFVCHTTDSYTIIITLTLSIDRLYAITNPIKIKGFVTNTHPKIIIISSFIILVVIKLPSTAICHLCTSQKVCTIFCTLISPIVFNILPALIISILNIVLILKIIKYNKMKPSIKTFRGGRVYLMTRMNNIQPITKLRKSRYFVIVTIALWLLFTNIPYYALLAYQFGLRTYFINVVTTAELQMATSVLFNSNHCINFFIYTCFHDVFRMNLVKLFSIWTK
jgi:hypothetical protein